MILNLVGAGFMVSGVFFLVVAAIGFARLPDVFCRLHVTGVLDTLGAPLILVGTAVILGASLVSLKLMMGIAFLVISSPLVGHLLARAALEAGHQPGVIEERSEHRWGEVARRQQRELEAGLEAGPEAGP
jgi:multicomponent Na+:H+ antiporter subunit G